MQVAYIFVEQLVCCLRKIYAIDEVQYIMYYPEQYYLSPDHDRFNQLLEYTTCEGPSPTAWRVLPSRPAQIDGPGAFRALI